MTRTNIVLDDELIQKAKKLTGLQTKRAVVNEALRVLIQLREQEQIRSLRGKLQWSESLNELRAGRFDTTG